jgi:hypothetical protein
VTSEGAKRQSFWMRWWRPAVLVLAWLVIALPIARAQLAELAIVQRMPGNALLLDAEHARALAGVAAALQVKGDQRQAMTLARAALAREPMNVVALRTLGLALEQSGDQPGANRVMFLAAGLGWRDVALQLWLIKAYALKNDVRGALRRADALARTNHLPEITFPLFLASITDDQLRGTLAREMADRPLWRGNFFYRLLQLPPEQMPYVNALVGDLAKVGSPITPQERAIYLTRLVQVGQGTEAYSYWLRDQRAVGVRASTVPWDAGFEHVPPPGALAAPFEWQVTPESAGVAQIGAASSAGQQLSVSPGRDYNGRLVSQTVVLQPGRYRVTARIQGDAAAIGLHWALRCVPSGEELPVDAGRDGAGFAPATFAVPVGTCPSQTLAIDMSSGDAIGDNGAVTIDDVSIQRLG